MASSPRFPDLSVTTVPAGPGRLTLLVVGDLDIAVKDRVLRAALDALDVPDIAEMVVDLTRTSFMDASGAYVLQRCRAAWAGTGRRLTVAGAGGMVAEVIHLTGVADKLGLPLRLGPRPHERREPLTACGPEANRDES